jgi:hypothetical protein
MFIGWSCCGIILVLTEDPCCELSPQEINNWVLVNTGIILEQIAGICKWNTGFFCEGVPAQHESR